MKGLLRVISAGAVAGLLVFISAAPSDAVVHARPSVPTRAFDGIWSVSIVTSQGDCNQAYRYPLRIWYGRVVKADNNPDYNVSGAVGRNGYIAVNVAGGGQTASGTGRLTPSYGAGVWHSTNGECSGHWTARRRG